MPLLNGVSQTVFEISDTPQRVGSNPVRLLRQLRLNLSLMHQLRSELRSLWTDSRPDLVICDLTVPVAGLLAQSMGIRWWTSTPTPCVVETGDGTPSYLGGWSPWNHPLGAVRDAAGRCLIRTFKKSLHFMFARTMRELGVNSIYREDGFETVYSPDTILALGVKEFEFPRSWPDWMIFCGPLTASPPFPHPAPEFVPGRQHVLVSLGTHLWWAKEHVRELMRKVAAQMPETVFHFTRGRTTGKDTETHADPDVPNFYTCEYIDYQQYIHRYDVVMNHGGTGVMYAALSQGVPILAWPQDYDQFDHTARLVWHGLGLKCRPNVNAIVHDLQRLLQDSKIQNCVREMQTVIGRYNAAELVEQRLR